MVHEQVQDAVRRFGKRVQVEIVVVSIANSVVVEEVVIVGFEKPCLTTLLLFVDPVQGSKEVVMP